MKRGIGSLSDYLEILLYWDQYFTMMIMKLLLFYLLIFLSIFSIGFSDTTEVCVANSENLCEENKNNEILDPKLLLQDQEDQEENTLVDNDATTTDETKIIPKGANAQGKPLDVSFDQCNDRYPQCVDWTVRGECEKNPGWMIINCPFSCQSCHLRDPNLRCDRARLNISTEPIYKSGDLDDIFSHLEENFGDRYGITVLSKSPWIVTFDNFVSDEEVEAIISSVNGKWERSTDTGQTNEFGETGRVLSQGRTSTNAWCREGCIDHPLVQRVADKIAEVTRVPTENYENFQILQYERGQFYRAHHDSSERQKLLACGPRILTFFLYLSDVEEGGETAFPVLGISVKPKKGKGLLWPSIMNQDPTMIDQRTLHEAKPVYKGKKYAANSWIHLYNFNIPNLWGCTGAFDML